MIIYNYVYNKHSNLYQALSAQTTYMPTSPGSQQYKLVTQTHYHYLSNGQLASKTVSTPQGVMQKITYVYDALARLVGATSRDSRYDEQYAYDANGNILSHPINGLDQLRTVQYDANGNQRNNIQGGRYFFNARNYLIGYQGTQQSSSMRYEYYPNGYRAAKQQALTHLHFYYDGSQLLTTEDAGQKTVNYLLADGRWYRKVSGNQGHYNLITRNGTVSAHLETTDQLKSSRRYSTYGAIQGVIFVPQILTLTHDPFAYDGEYLDAESGLSYLRARYYNPSNQRFISQDSYPLMNRYGFGKQDPLNQVDPSGHLSIGEKMGRGVLGALRGITDGIIGMWSFGLLSTYGYNSSGFLGLNAVITNHQWGKWGLNFLPFAPLLRGMSSKDSQGIGYALGLSLYNLLLFARGVWRIEPKWGRSGFVYASQFSDSYAPHFHFLNKWVLTNEYVAISYLKKIEARAGAELGDNASTLSFNLPERANASSVISNVSNLAEKVERLQKTFDMAKVSSQELAVKLSYIRAKYNGGVLAGTLGDQYAKSYWMPRAVTVLHALAALDTEHQINR